MEKKLTVIIPSYNAGRYIGEAIESVWSQVEDAEIIVIDDESNDNTVNVAKEYGVCVLTQKHGGAAKARNLALKQVNGDFIFLLDADDVSCPGAIARMFEFLTDDVCAVFGRTEDFISPDLTLEQKNGLIPRDGAYSGILPGASLFKRDVFDKVGLFDENLCPGEVVDWMIRFRNSGLASVNIDDTVLKRRLHMNNTGRVDRKSELANYAAIIRKMRK